MLKIPLAFLTALTISASAISQTAAPTPAPAPDPVLRGVVDEVTGLVTVSDGSTIGNVVKGTLVVDGNRFVTSSSGDAMLKFNNGCKIELKPSRSLTIDGDKNCDALIAAIQSLDNNNGVFALLANPLVGIGALASAALISTARNNGGPISGQ